MKAYSFGAPQGFPGQYHKIHEPHSTRMSPWDQLCLQKIIILAQVKWALNKVNQGSYDSQRTASQSHRNPDPSPISATPWVLLQKEKDKHRNIVHVDRPSPVDRIKLDVQIGVDAVVQNTESPLIVSAQNPNPRYASQPRKRDGKQRKKKRTKQKGTDQRSLCESAQACMLQQARKYISVLHKRQNNVTRVILSPPQSERGREKRRVKRAKRVKWRRRKVVKIRGREECRLDEGV